MQGVHYRREHRHSSNLMGAGEMNRDALPYHIHTDEHLAPEESREQDERASGWSSQMN